MNKSIKYASIAASIVIAVLAVGIVATVGLAAPTVAQSSNMSGGASNMSGGASNMSGGASNMTK
jgi:hypothetical protein